VENLDNNLKQTALNVIMSKFRPTYDEEWKMKIREYIKNNPKEGFEEGEEKTFVKYAVNKYMAQKQELEKLKDKLNQEIESK